MYQSLKEMVYEYISDEIRTKRLKTNDKVNELAISKKLNVSRTPVREALVQLSADGLLEMTPRRGFRVMELGIKTVQDLYTVLGALDVLAANIAIKLINRKDLDKMDELIHKMNKAIEDYDFKEYYHLQVEFHNVYVNKTDNDILIDEINRLKKRFVRQSYSNIDDPKMKEALAGANKEHEEILSCFKTDNIRRLKKVLVKHWNVNYADLDSID